MTREYCSLISISHGGDLHSRDGVHLDQGTQSTMLLLLLPYCYEATVSFDARRIAELTKVRAAPGF